MRAAINLAKLGSGFTNPNPLVGAVIVKDGRIIGEGWHERYGDLHAERNALAHCMEDPAGADMYVTLEPCCHYGKQPPCTEAVIEAGIKRLFVGSYDPNPLVSGKSLDMLREHGIEVTERVLQEECDALNEIFFHYITTGTPYIIMKTAITIDGRTATKTGDAKWITNPISREHTHKTRKRAAAIMVGVNTVIADDPMLNCRVEEPSHPVRIVCDSHIRIPLDSRIMQTARDIPVIIAASEAEPERIEAVKSMGADVILTGGDRVDIAALMRELGSRGIDSVIIEGGAELHASVLESVHVNKLQVYIAPKIIGGEGAKPCVGGAGAAYLRDAYMFSNPEVTRLGDDILIEYKQRVNGGCEECSPE